MHNLLVPLTSPLDDRLEKEFNNRNWHVNIAKEPGVIYCDYHKRPISATEIRFESEQYKTLFLLKWAV